MPRVYFFLKVKKLQYKYNTGHIFSLFIFIKTNKKMLASKSVSTAVTSLIKQGRSIGRRYYGLPASAINLGTDPRKDKTVQLTPYRGVNIIHDPLLSKGKQTP
jgi:hypothetical protein